MTRRLPALLLLLCLLPAAGCSLGNRYIFNSSPEVIATPEERGLPYEEVWFPSSGGARLHGWYVPGSPGRPLVLFFHGNAANISHRVENLDYLHRLGLPVFIFDYRGFGASAGTPTGEEDIYEDARSAVAWLAGRGWSPARTVYYGRSMGAAVALQMALERPPAGLVMECSFTSLREIARHMTPVTYALVGWWGLDNMFDNLGKIDALDRPLLLFHGDSDTIAPPAMAERLFAAANEPKTFLLVPGAGHSDAWEIGGQTYRDAWLAFLSALAGRTALAETAVPPSPSLPD
ncbi:alpha/beta hydrolase [Desulfuromonas sp.]|uniref:alpha/beta hydrolase n=1 Tax=Desulfuromonas sp. TaxID=892 RepID=UPI0025B96DBE|nr:alpha/beta hydrolase [Desulfuromonas sp.]